MLVGSSKTMRGAAQVLALVAEQRPKDVAVLAGFWGPRAAALSGF